jgi:hypothetical protein
MRTVFTLVYSRDTASFAWRVRRNNESSVSTHIVFHGTRALQYRNFKINLQKKTKRIAAAAELLRAGATSKAT